MRVCDVVENYKNVYPDIIVLIIENNICSKRDRAVGNKINGIELYYYRGDYRWKTDVVDEGVFVIVGCFCCY